MARVTQVQQIERENEQQALAFFETMLSALPDPRRRQGVRYPLKSVVVIALMAMVCGSDDADAMALWAELNAEWLSGFLDLPHGTPSQDVFLAVFAALDPAAFGAVFRAWAELLVGHLKREGRHIAVDGKTNRRSFDTQAHQPAIHTVSAWLSDEGLVLGQEKTHAKSNEITAIPELLRTLDLRGATLTIDAMGCQTNIAQVITEGGGHYLLAVKDNQPSLHQDIATTFTQAHHEDRPALDTAVLPTEVFSETDKGHGRVEHRSVTLCRDLGYVASAQRWPGLSFVVKVERERTVLATQKTSIETAYYIGSGTASSVADVAGFIRRHWSIETGLHWVLDMAFCEDNLRHRAKNTAQNMTMLRHFALNIVKQDKARKVGIALSRKRAGWDRSYLISLLTGGMGATA
jgi:predicted transposase YbfD/YdcC